MFFDRWEAGRCLATRLQSYRVIRPIVIGIAGDGVPVAFEVAQALRAPLEIFLPDRPIQQPDGAPSRDLAGRTAILVDDGIKTGRSIRKALDGVRPRGPDRILVAVPVAPRVLIKGIAREVDHLLVLVPIDFATHLDSWYAQPPESVDIEELLTRAT